MDENCVSSGFALAKFHVPDSSVFEPHDRKEMVRLLIGRRQLFVVSSSQYMSVSVTSMSTSPVAVAGVALSRLKAPGYERLFLMVDSGGMDEDLGGVAVDGSLPGRCPLTFACHDIGRATTELADTPLPVNTLDVLVGTGGGTLPTRAVLFLADKVTATSLADHPPCWWCWCGADAGRSTRSSVA